MNKRLFERIARKHGYRLSAQKKTRDEEQQRFNDERRAAQEANIKTAEQLDKSLLVLSSGAIGLSVTFMDKSWGLHDRIDSTFLKISWVFFGLTIVMVILSFWFSNMAFAKHIDIYEKQMRGEGLGWNYWKRLTTVVNILASVFFVAGVAVYALFAWNLF